MHLLESDTFSGIYKFDTTLLLWSKIAYWQPDIPRGRLTSFNGKILLCGSLGGNGEKSLVGNSVSNVNR